MWCVITFYWLDEQGREIGSRTHTINPETFAAYVKDPQLVLQVALDGLNKPPADGFRVTDRDGVVLFNFPGVPASS